MEINCGRPTKSGTTCKNRTAGMGRGLIQSCTTHKTPEDVVLMEIIERAYAKGVESERSRGQWELVNAIREEKRVLRQKFQEDHRVADHSFRLRTDKDQQIVEVSGYAYIWNGPSDLGIGDSVILPAGWSGNQWVGRVSALGTTYTGQMSSIIGKQ